MTLLIIALELLNETNKNVILNLFEKKLQCFESGSVWIRFILVSRIRIRFKDTDPLSKKSDKIMENFHKNQPKSQEYHTFFRKY